MKDVNFIKLNFLIKCWHYTWNFAQCKLCYNNILTFYFFTLIEIKLLLQKFLKIFLTMIN